MAAVVSLNLPPTLNRPGVFPILAGSCTASTSAAFVTTKPPGRLQRMTFQTIGKPKDYNNS
jgi:hypothetical protein